MHRHATGLAVVLFWCATASASERLLITVPEGERELLRSLQLHGQATLPADSESLLRTVQRALHSGELTPSDAASALSYLSDNGHGSTAEKLLHGTELDAAASEAIPLVDLTATLPEFVVRSAIVQSGRFAATDRVLLSDAIRSTNITADVLVNWDVDAGTPLSWSRGQDAQRRLEPTLTVPELEQQLSRENPTATVDAPEAAAADSCATAVRELRAAVEGCDWACQVGAMSGDSNDTRLQRIRERGKHYDRACLARSTPYPHDGAISADALPPRVQTARAQRAVGVFVATSPDGGREIPFCGGVAVAPDRVLTAHHCFGEYSGLLIYPAMFSNWSITFRVSDLVASSFALQPRVERAGSGPPAGQGGGGPGDYIVIRLEQSIPDLPTVTFRQAQPGERLWVYGHFVHYDRTGDLMTTAPSWKQGLRWTKVAPCQVYAVDETCIIHTCQTDHGFSGTPLISLDTGHDAEQLVVVGMQTHAPGSMAKACAHLNTGGVGLNAGLTATHLSSNALNMARHPGDLEISLAALR